MSQFDLVVVGAGVGGYSSAIRAAQLGMKTAIVERRSVLGGTCLNEGCIPSKAMLESSELFHMAGHEAAVHGVVLPEVKLDLEAMLSRKRGIVQRLTDGVRVLMKKNRIKVYEGHARLDGAGRVVVSAPESDEEILEAKHVLLATGSVPTELPHIPFDGRHVVSSTEALSFESVPEHLVVVGAGAVGLELGSVWARLGAKVTVVEILPRILPFADKQMASALQRALKGQGIELRLKTRVTGAVVDGDTVTVALTDDKDNGDSLVCDRLLVAVGRRPYAADLGLDTVGLSLDERGRLAVDNRFATSAPGVYAVGDLIGGFMLAHEAEEEGIAAVEGIAGLPIHYEPHTMPSVVYTDPELASAGATEEQLKEEKRKYRVGRFLFRANGRAMSMERVEGSVKMLADEETDALLGVHIVGPHASELLAEAALALANGVTAEQLARTIHAHPTLSEVMKEAGLAVHKRAIHG